MANLTAKQQRFIDEYLIDLNATQAAIRAGYSEKTAYSIGERLLRNVEVKSAIDQRLTKIQSEKTADAKEIMEYLTTVLRGEAVAEIVVVESMGEGCSSARCMDKHPDEKERLKAAELLGRRYGLFTDKVRVEGDTAVIIIDDVRREG